MRSRVIAGVASMLLCTLVLVAPAHAAFPGANGKIAFYMYRSPDPGDGYQIYLIKDDGTGLTQLTSSVGHSMEADWSADGSRLVFQRESQEAFSYEFDLYAMNADGSGQVRLTSFVGNTSSGPRSAENPSWSLDNSQIAFDTGQEFGNAQALVVNADGTGVTNIAADSFYERAPSWSPKGDRIAFPGTFNGQDGIYTVRPDGSDVRLAVPGLWNRPDWSPDGSKLAFGGFGANNQIWVANVDGSGLRMLTAADNVAELLPVWSPDGTKIAFQRISSSATNLWVMSSGGGNERLVFDSPAGPSPSSWQPLPGPQRGDYKNAAQFCKAEREFLGDAAFARKYGSNSPKKNVANAYGKCVSAK
jgi:Tol biopolymer transport system component